MAEKSGTTTNIEGRVSTVTQKVTVHGTARPDWMVAVELASALGHDLGVSSVDDITARLAGAGAVAGSIWQGSVTPGQPVSVWTSAPNGYDMRLVLSRVLYDGAVSTRSSASIAALIGPGGVSMHPLDMEQLGVVAADEVRLSTDRGSIVLGVCPDERLDRGTVWIPIGQNSEDPRLLVGGGAVTDIRIERV